MLQLDYNDVRALYKSQGAVAVAKAFREGVQDQRFKPEDVSWRQLARAVGAVDESDLNANSPEVQLIEACHGTEGASREKVFGEGLLESRHDGMLRETTAGVNTALFQVITGELLASAVIMGYENAGAMIGDRLMRTIQTRVRGQRIPGVKELGGGSEVAEGHEYDETTFEEKYVTTQETKRGVIISITEELVTLDQTGIIMDRARRVGKNVAMERERIRVRAVQDVNSNVYRPSGAAAALYNTDGSNLNYIGSGNTTSPSAYQSAVPLQNWTDLDVVRSYRATEVVDDRTDGAARPMVGFLNGPQQILVPEALRTTAWYIQNATHIEKSHNTAVDVTRAGNPNAMMIREILASPFVDEVDPADWYFGDFQEQFVWSEVWPLRVFTQSGDSESAFSRDTVFRAKARYYGGVAATDTIYVTKVDGG